MPTSKQALGTRGERLVAQAVPCPGCKSGARTLRLLPPNFKCADVVCDFCGYLSQVKSKAVTKLPAMCPKTFPGAAWGPQQDRMDAGIFFSLFLVLEAADGSASVYFLPRDLQTKEMFVPRNPLSTTARRAGWQGFRIDVSRAIGTPTLVHSQRARRSVAR